MESQIPGKTANMKRTFKVILALLFIGLSTFGYFMYQQNQQLMEERSSLRIENEKLDTQLRRYQSIFVDSLGRMGADLQALNELPLQLQMQSTHFQHFFYIHDLNKDGIKDTLLLEKDDSRCQLLVMEVTMADTVLFDKFPQRRLAIKDTIVLHQASANLSRTDVQLTLIPHEKEDHLAITVSDFGGFNYMSLIRPYRGRFISAFDMAYSDGLQIESDTISLRWRKNGAEGGAQMETRYIWLESKNTYQYQERSIL